MSNYKKVKKQSDNPFLNLYKLDAVDREGKVFDYYFVSRRDEEGIKLKTKDNNPEGIVVYAITDEESPRLLVIKEYRYPLDEYIYELPAGIIDPGEVAEQAAVREIKEETGFNLKVYNGGNKAFRRSFYLGPGFTDESNGTVFGTIHVEEVEQQLESAERIQVMLADKEQVKRILKEERVTLRGAYLMMMYLKSGDGLDFLEV
jgi:ADP-ribose pyrophosphatase